MDEKVILKTYDAKALGEGVVRVCVSSGRVDRDTEIIDPKAFDYQEFDRHPILLSSHSVDSLTRNIGKAIKREVVDNKVYMTFKYFIGEGNFEADWGYKLVKEGVAAYSVGFIPKQWKDVGKDGVRRIYTNIELLEVSQVLIPANPDAVQEGALLHAIKSFSQYIDGYNKEEYKGVVPYKKFPLAPKDAKWSFTAQDGNEILGDPPNWDRYRSVHCWYDSSNPEVRASYKLPVAKIYNGSIHVFWRGVVAAMASLLGARGGVNIPDKDKKGVYNRLAKYYKDFGEEPPEFREYSSDELKFGAEDKNQPDNGQKIVETLRGVLEKMQNDTIIKKSQEGTDKSVPKGTDIDILKALRQIF